MKITLTNAGKRFNRDWIFRHLDFEFCSGERYAIVGPNGSGKSTLLQLISGAVAASEGTIAYESQGHRLDDAGVYQHLALAAPYLELIEEMTLLEFLKFHEVFKPLRSDRSISQILETVHLENAAHKQIRYFSSGMKQRAKLAQALFSKTPLLLLDEPCTNLDSAGIALYQSLMHQQPADRTIIVSSNDEQEYQFCNHRLDLRSYKRP